MAAIIAHLLTDLTADARREWETTPGPLVESNCHRHVHDAVHARLGAVSRSLRRTKPGVPVHAACCTLPDGRGVLIAGPTGSGKSTLSAVLGVRFGATMVSDDTVWLAGSRASSIGAPIALRAGSPYWDRARRLWYADDSSRLLVRPDDLGMPSARSSGPLDLLVLVRYEPAGSGLIPINPAEAFCRLAGSLLRDCAPDEIDALAELAAQLPTASISYSDVETSIDLCTRFFETATMQHPVEPRRLDDQEIEQAGLCRDVQGMRFGDDVAMWRPPSGQVIYLRDWPGGSLWETPAEEALAAMGFLERKETPRARQGSA